VLRLTEPPPEPSPSPGAKPVRPWPTSIAAQQTVAIRGDSVLIDEIEHGLEPYRLQHVLYRVRQSTAAGQGQVIVTTHSPVAVQALQAGDISVVRSGRQRQSRPASTRPARAKAGRSGDLRPAGSPAGQLMTPPAV
jgi:ABC-type multidrug transport system ATPase subunit